jgi:hypothetical protein
MIREGLSRHSSFELSDSIGDLCVIAKLHRRKRVVFVEMHTRLVKPLQVILDRLGLAVVEETSDR